MEESKKTQLKTEIVAAIEEVGVLLKATWTCQCGGSCQMSFALTSSIVIGELSDASLRMFLGQLDEDKFYEIVEISLKALKKNIELAEEKAVSHTQAHADA
jgi:hypothetical protein